MPDVNGRQTWVRYARVTVRGLLVAVLIVGGGLGYSIRRVRLQREAVVAIHQLGGEVYYEWQRGDDWPARQSVRQPRGPKWLLDRIGVDYFNRVTLVVLPKVKAQDALAHVANLGAIRVLDMGGSDISDTGLSTVKDMSNLRRIELGGTNITDQGLARLSELTGLEYLGLEGTHISDSGLAHLKTLRNLKHLQLVSTHVGDAGMIHLAALAGLELLDLSWTDVGDPGLRHLERLNNLRWLNLAFMKHVTDRGIRSLQAALPGVTVPQRNWFVESF
jgi:Leucine Rich repeat